MMSHVGIQGSAHAGLPSPSLFSIAALKIFVDCCLCIICDVCWKLLLFCIELAGRRLAAAMEILGVKGDDPKLTQDVISNGNIIITPIILARRLTAGSC